MSMKTNCMNPFITQSADVSVGAFSFNSTTATLAVVTEAGREFFAATFGAGAVSVELAKSQLPAFAAFAATKGVTVG